MKYAAVIAIFALFAVAMAATTPEKTEPKADLQSSSSLIYPYYGYGYPLFYGKGLLGYGYGLGLGYGLGYGYGYYG